MAARARERRAQDDAALRLAADEAARAAFESTAQRPWLNGWTRESVNTVRMGTGMHCVCCGRCTGVVCTAVMSDWEPPGPEPVWPFEPTDCPLCAGMD
ncbi:hypothetical protein DSM43518_02006 [Mycobacterium marinum]|nr:hypothetical protein DSM43518_02006 [Mycobacterium marinum]